MRKEIKEKIIEAQKEFITHSLFKMVKDKSMTKNKLKSDFEKCLLNQKGVVFQIADIHASKDIENHRNGYDVNDYEVFVGEQWDNSSDAHATRLDVITKDKENETVLSFIDNGTGIKDLISYLRMGCEDKNRFSPSIGLGGQGAKLLAATVIIYVITETKRVDGTIESILWYFNYKKDRIVYIELKPRNIIDTTSGTYVEAHFLKEALDIHPRDLEREIHDIFGDIYHTFILKHPGAIQLNGNEVFVEPFPKPEKKLNFKSSEGFLIITENNLPPEECGLSLNIYGRDVCVLGLENDFGIDVPSKIKYRVTGYIKENKLKPIIHPTKTDIIKMRKGYVCIWQKFRKKMRKEIVEFLQKEGYLDTRVLKGSDVLTSNLNRDLLYLIRKNKVAKTLFSKIQSPRIVIPPSNLGSKDSIPAYTEKREGEGKIDGIIIFTDSTKNKGFDNATPVDAFFSSNPAPNLISNNDESIVKVYKIVVGQPKIRLIDDIKIIGPHFIIDNVPLDTDLLIKAYTTYGNPENISEPLGRPWTYVHLTKRHKEEKVVIPISRKQGIYYEGLPKSESVDIGLIEEEIDANDKDEVKKKIVYNTAHPLYKMALKNGPKAEYVSILSAIIYAVTNLIDEPDNEMKKKQVWKNMLATVNRR